MVFVDDKAIAINALIDAVEAIEQELGITPSGVYADVRVRLDILEARINNPLAPAPNVENPFFIGNDGVTISVGFGAPTENRLPGSLYLREDGYSNEGVYARRPDGYWHLIDTDPFTASGDLSGTIYTQTVIGLQNRPVSPGAPQTDSEGDGYVLTWNSVANWWEPQIGFFAAGDLDGYKLTQTVVNLQGTPIVIGSVGAAQDGYSLIWNNSVPRWEPQRLAVVFDPLNSGLSTNIRSNRYLTQSPINNSKTGIVNLSSDSTQTSLGATGDYTVLVGGNQNQATGDYSVVVGGFQNSIASSGSFIGGGFNNTISLGADDSVIGGGDDNTVAGDHSLIGSGSSNIVNGIHSSIINGNVNLVDGYYSFIGGGDNNSVGGYGSAIVGGTTNAITGFNIYNYNFIGAGQLNNITYGSNSTILAGTSNSLAGNNSSIIAGSSNTITGLGTFADILGGSFNTITNNDAAGFLTVLSGAQHQLSGTFNIIHNGSFNTITINSSFSNLLNGVSNQIDGYHNTILSSNSCSITGTNSVILNGDSNVITSDFTVVAGTNNNVNSGSDYSFVNGVNNTTNSQYLSIVGDVNSIGSSSDYTKVGGRTNSVTGAPYVHISGAGNTVLTNDGYSAVFGANNSLAASSPNSFIKGNSNQISGINSGIFGNSNVLFGDNSYIFGNNGLLGTISTPSSHSFVYGDFGRSVYNGQVVHSAHSVNGTAGSSQYSRVILDGAQASGGQFALNSSGDGYLTLEDGKAYDMCIRVLVNNTSGSPTCARYIYDVLAHCESGTLTLDVINATLIDDNGTGWTVSILALTNQIAIQVDSSGVLDRRAIATVEWRELSRN